MIELVRHRTGLLAEISPCSHYAGTGLPEQLAAQLLAVPHYLDQTLERGEFAVQSFSPADAKAFRTRLPEVPIGVLAAERPTDAELVELSTWADHLTVGWERVFVP